MAMDIQSGNRIDEERRVRTFGSRSFAYPYVEPPLAFAASSSNHIASHFLLL